MKTHLGHLQINVKDPAVSFPFYKEFFKYFEYHVIVEGDEYLGFSNGSTDIWINVVEPAHGEPPFHRKRAGLNHLCFRVSSKEEVDRFSKEFLKSNNLPTLYETPKLFPEYSSDYYAVFFEDPERIKIEVAHY